MVLDALSTPLTRLKTVPHADSLEPGTRRLMERMLSPLCGISTHLGVFLRGPREPRFVVAGGDLTGVHLLQGLSSRPDTPYHIGGGGIHLQEALIRALAETLERYGQLVSGQSYSAAIEFTTYDELVRRGKRVLAPDLLRYFTPEQHAGAACSFQPFRPDAPVGWISTPALTGPDPVWVPAQTLLLGVQVRAHDGEPWLLPAVTTGTAAHTDPAKAVRAALLELVQIDALMGHWFTDRCAVRIGLDERTRGLEHILGRYLSPNGPSAEFYWVPSVDLPGMVVACLLCAPGRPVSTVVGAGVDLSLTSAMYKALVEATGVFQLAKYGLTSQLTNGVVPEVNPNRITDLDSNVAWHAAPERGPRLRAKFGGDGPEVLAAELPPDVATSPQADIRHLVKAFKDTGKELVLLDLTTGDVADLGFTVARVWSPHTLSLCLPSLPPLAHRRFQDYGGARYAAPHPYP